MSTTARAMEPRRLVLGLCRAALGAVFIYFGGEELAQPGPWVGYMPALLGSHVDLWLVLLHGLALFVTGAALVVGTQLRLFAPLAVLLMGSIAADLLIGSGPSAIWFRDFGLTALAVALWAGDPGLALDDMGATAPEKQAPALAPARSGARRAHL